MRSKPDTKPKVFLSHASIDSVMAMNLCYLLEQRDVCCWIAPRDLTPGRPYSAEIVQGIEGCGSFLLLATKSAMLSDNVLNELEQAHRTNRELYTVMVDSPKLTGDVSYYIARLHWLPLHGNAIEDVADKLSRVLHGSTQWEAVAAKPSLSRTVRHSLPSFTGALTAVTLGLVLLAVAAVYLVGQTRLAIQRDYTSIGWTSLDSSDAGPNVHELSGYLWMGDENLIFSSVKLRAREFTATGTIKESDLSAQLPPSGAGKAPIRISVSRGSKQVKTILAVQAEGRAVCVEQTYPISSTFQIGASGAPKVSQADSLDRCVW